SPTLLDYGEVLLFLLPLERRSTNLFSYICELSLLYSALATTPPAKLACTALLLTRALHHYGKVALLYHMHVIKRSEVRFMPNLICLLFCRSCLAHSVEGLHRIYRGGPCSSLCAALCQMVSASV
ncbi:hypothetical protein XENOCAPTIV_003390, partial [Xenoophorus captivus]